MNKVKLVGFGAVVAAALALPATALAKRGDRNHDRIPDRWEARHHLSLKVNEARKDQDRDGLNNLREYALRTNPRAADTDRDGVDDGAEVRDHTNPRKADSDNDGTADGAEDADGDGVTNAQEQEPADQADDNGDDSGSDDTADDNSDDAGSSNTGDDDATPDD